MISVEDKPYIPVLQMTDQALAMAEAVVSSICKRAISISISSQGMTNLDVTHELFDQKEPEVIAISQRLQGALQGHVIFVLKYQTSMKLLRDILKENARLRELTEMEEEALLELGNIIINSYLSSYLSNSQVEINSHLPTLDRDHYAQVLDEYRPELINDELFYIQLQISFNDHDYQACLFWTGVS